ncbi:MAG TPA: lysylphosphatidylglycerol synthase transmembrane domain-containing protein [Pseudonocardia sp.]
MTRPETSARRGGPAVAARLWPAVKLVGGVAILAVLVAELGSRAVVDALASVGPGAVLAALALGLLTTAASAARWCLVARALGVALPLATAVGDCYRATFLNSVLPAGVLGDVHRAVGYGRRIGDVGRGVRIVALERVTGQLAIVVLGVGVLVGARPALLVDVLRPGGAGAAELLAALVAVAALGLVLARTPRAARVRAALREALADARDGVLARGTWPALLGLSVVTLAGYLALFVVAARAAGVTAPLSTLLPLLVLGLLAMVVPLNVGGWGPREGVLAVAFSAAGLGAAQGLATAVVYGVLGLVACLPGAVVLVLPAVRPTPAPDPMTARPREEHSVIELARSPIHTAPAGTTPRSAGEVAA